jgi:hypothetical protein
MRDAGWLILVRAARGGRESAGRPAEYRINPEWIKGADFASLKPAEKGAEIAPNKSEKGANPDINGCNPEHERVQNEAEKGATAIAPEPSVNPHEPSAAATTHENSAVDNPAAAAADDEDQQSAGSTPLDVEARLTDLLIELEAERGKRLVVDRSRDRLHIVTWVGRQLTEAEMRVAHARAAGARQRDRDARALNVGFVANFVDEVLAERDGGAPAAGGEVERPAQWWLSDSGIGAQGKRMHIDRRPNEHTPDYLIRVAKASGRGPWIDYVLKREQGGGRYQQVIDFFGDALMPTDHYAS